MAGHDGAPAPQPERAQTRVERGDVGRRVAGSGGVPRSTETEQVRDDDGGAVREGVVDRAEAVACPDHAVQEQDNGLSGAHHPNLQWPGAAHRSSTGRPCRHRR